MCGSRISSQIATGSSDILFSTTEPILAPEIELNSPYKKSAISDYIDRRLAETRCVDKRKELRRQSSHEILGNV